MTEILQLKAMDWFDIKGRGIGCGPSRPSSRSTLLLSRGTMIGRGMLWGYLYMIRDDCTGV